MQLRKQKTYQKDDQRREDSWEQPVPLAESDLPEFPVEALPKPLRQYISALAISTQTPPGMAGMFALSVISTAIQRKAVVDCRNWQEPLCLWTLSVTPPGSRSTAVAKAVSGPLYDFQHEKNLEIEQSIRKVQSDVKIIDAKLSAAEKTIANAQETEQQLTAIQLRDDLLEEKARLQVPVPLRLVTDDATPEAIAKLMHEQGERLAFISTEGGIFGMMAGRYSDKGSNLDVYLKGHGGDPILVDRIGRAPIILDSPTLTLGLRVQPDVLQGLTAQPSFRGLGLLARFLYYLPENEVGFRLVGGDVPPMPPEVESAYTSMVRDLLETTGRIEEDRTEKPFALTFEADAYVEFVTYWQGVEDNLRPGAELDPIKDWGSKLHGAVARLAGVLHCARYAGRKPFTRKIEVQTVQKAIVLARCFVTHAIAAFQEMGADAGLEGAKRILGWLEREPRLAFSKRDAHRANRGIFKRASDLDVPLAILRERGFIRDLEKADRAGRPSEAFQVNPLWLARNGKPLPPAPPMLHELYAESDKVDILVMTAGCDQEEDAEELTWSFERR